MLPKDFLNSAKICGIGSHLKDEGHLFIERNKVLSLKETAGIRMELKELANGIKATVVVSKGAKIGAPQFFCIGFLGKKGDQFIMPQIEVKDDAEFHLLTHCSFPKAHDVKHKMEGFFRVGKNAKFFYQEYHYHGGHSGAKVDSKLKTEIDEGGYYRNDFNLTKGTVGEVSIDLEAVLIKNARAELDVKVLGKSKNDKINILERVYLNGENSKGIIKMRAAAKNGGQVLMQGETYARSAGCQGHIDCQEIVIGKNSIARAVPIVEVNNDQARVTHEASVGKINQKELEALMAKGLNEEEATDLIVGAMLR